MGGMWNADDNSFSTSSPKTYPSLVSNTSKMMTCFSDFLFSEETPAYMTQKMIYNYLVRYVDHFKLRNYIQCKTEIQEVSKARDYDETGNWELAIEDSDGKRRVEIFNAVMICTGSLRKPRYPDIEGMRSFQGKIEHAMGFRTGEVYKGKNVVVIGNSFSAGDISCAAAGYANQVHISVGQGCTLITRFDENGFPLDMQMLKREYLYSPTWTIPFFKKQVMKWSSLAINHDVVGMHSNRDILFSAVMTNDEIGLKIMTGKVKVVGRVLKMVKRSVHIDDGTVVDDVDVVVFATGYERHLPFLDNSLVDSAQAIKDQRNDWYKLIFPVHLRHPTLAMVGMVTAEGPNLPIFEMQSRFAARVFCGKLKLPEKCDMLKDIDKWNSDFKLKFSFYKHQVPFIRYMDEVSAELGVKPDFWKLIWRDPRLAYLCTFGPASPVQYRLLGPHSNAEAVNHCYAIYKNTFSGVRHRRVPPRKPITLLPTHIQILIAAVFVGVLYCIWLTYFL
ncbi:dimethylaniline monooxygenase [N-oxide-forming] 2-like isoform X2 [Gigantopelta aegis]|uniref:dimethylaniline monooxygenase [N-oxide-forming] 2-like isoform X2 n=1 Tax=Gigantopelta aegis TaxID=1735272 RepID=UPI001B888509|nr:dimethylaniline monooxygenase [N-oxide-forming] 2-like isoform X2 [Gigantopelta aegis]